MRAAALALVAFGSVLCGAAVPMAAEPAPLGDQLYCGHTEADITRNLASAVGDSHGYDTSKVVSQALDAANTVADWAGAAAQQAGHDWKPLKAIFYVDSNDVYTTCDHAKSGPFARGAGDEACDLTTDQSGLHSLPGFFDQILTHTDWSGSQAHIAGFGTTASRHFRAALHGGVYVPQPNANHSTHIDSIGDLQHYRHVFWGSTGGGGGGFGWELSCDDRVILSGGGGGGGGFSSPEHGDTAYVGGGGGGGIQDEHGNFVGAGAGVDGQVHINPKGQWGPVQQYLQNIATRLKGCSAIEVRGGGGGGAGFAVYEPWDVTSKLDSPNEFSPHALSFGWGMQFSTGNSLTVGKLVQNGLSGPAFSSCPSEDTCNHCFDGHTTPSGSGTVSAQLMLGCASRIAASICSHATAADGASYGKYASVMSCNNVLVAHYLKTHLTDADKMLWSGFTAYTQSIPGTPPPISPTGVEKEWCRKPPGHCPSYPGC